MKKRFMYAILVSWIALVITVLYGCTVEYYKTTGTIEEVDCQKGVRSGYSKITLDNGVTYFDSENYSCMIEVGTKVDIKHTSDLNISSLVVEGAKKVKVE